jgi:hypothetical protein
MKLRIVRRRTPRDPDDSMTLGDVIQHLNAVDPEYVRHLDAFIRAAWRRKRPRPYYRLPMRA